MAVDADIRSYVVTFVKRKYEWQINDLNEKVKNLEKTIKKLTKDIEKLKKAK